MYEVEGCYNAHRNEPAHFTLGFYDTPADARAALLRLTRMALTHRED